MGRRDFGFFPTWLSPALTGNDKADGRRGAIFHHAFDPSFPADLAIIQVIIVQQRRSEASLMAAAATLVPIIHSVSTFSQKAFKAEVHVHMPSYRALGLLTFRSWWTI